MRARAGRNPTNSRFRNPNRSLSLPFCPAPFSLTPRRIFRVSRVTAMLGSLGFASYAFGQMEVVDDPEGYSRKALMSILLGEGTEVMMICTATFEIIFGQFEISFVLNIPPSHTTCDIMCST